MNKCVLIGRLTKDPELKFLPGSGKANCRFTIAVNREYKKDETDFINCVAWGKTAETISQYMIKGRQIAVSGSIRTRSFDKQDGTKVYTTDVNVDHFEFVGGKNEGQAPSNNQSSFNDDITPVDDIDGDMPFN
ncbi:single-stranded DNA-binding protein [Clostridium paraputrificum]|uniref:single-stranded DNA-binding protein n=1 Tax=Clostridium paraputrificum TaxID=29363 RepID=UPI000EA3A26F|nr:single-stranded DNA-binding protein [Clostridium paraputrificum]RKI45786.1 single-stranded DNA-binding protein [Clostridium paraputrificum]